MTNERNYALYDQWERVCPMQESMSGITNKREYVWHGQRERVYAMSNERKYVLRDQ